MTAEAKAATGLTRQTWFSEPSPKRDRTGERPWQVTKTRRDGVTQTYHVSDNHKGPGGMTPEDAMCG